MPMPAPEREHQQIAARRHEAAAEHDDPIDRLLAGIEQVCRRMFLAEAAALLAQESQSA
jgi:hypothetical protein